MSGGPVKWYQDPQEDEEADGQKLSNSKLDSVTKQRTINWVKSVTELPTSEDVTDEQESCTSNYEEWEDSNLDPDDPTEELSTTTVADNRTHDQHVSYKCEWNECSFSTDVENDFFKHVTQHKPVSEMKDTEDKSGQVAVWCCLWDSCGFDSESWISTLRHINYHAYHSKIKNVGYELQKALQLPECMLDYEGRNLLPVITHDHICQWDDCSDEFNSVQLFFLHVRCHVNSLPRGEKNRPLVCAWRGCNKRLKSYMKVVDHVRTHTQEKLVGCPTCGGLFANKAKFQDHCQRQKERKRFKCSHCQRLYATEKLLRVHIKVHVNKYKCPMCDMTCLYPSSLSTHIRYRHLDHKPFKCNFCDHRSVTEADLETHQFTHCSDNFWVCEQDKCEFSCRSQCALKYHTRMVHGRDSERLVYRCHLCTKKFRVGFKLTNHLQKEHDFTSASDGTRFRYIHSVNGNYTFQTHRYANIEVIREITKKDKIPIDHNKTKRYRVTIDTKPSVVIVEDNEEQVSDKENMNEDDEDTTTQSSEPVEHTREENNLEQVLAVDDEQCEPEPKKIKKETEESLNEEVTIVGSKVVIEDILKKEKVFDDKMTEVLVSDDSSDFGDKLKNYLGLTGSSNIIKVMKKK